jgi:hypothetical protein
MQLHKVVVHSPKTMTLRFLKTPQTTLKNLSAAEKRHHIGVPFLWVFLVKNSVFLQSKRRVNAAAR